MGYFNYVGFDEWEVETSRNPIVEEARITHATLLIVEVFLVQSPSEALGGSALHLPFDITRMKRLADVLRYASSQDLNFARFRVDLDVKQAS